MNFIKWYKTSRFREQNKNKDLKYVSTKFRIRKKKCLTFKNSA